MSVMRLAVSFMPLLTLAAVTSAEAQVFHQFGPNGGTHSATGVYFSRGACSVTYSVFDPVASWLSVGGGGSFVGDGINPNFLSVTVTTQPFSGWDGRVRFAQVKQTRQGTDASCNGFGFITVAQVQCGASLIARYPESNYPAPASGTHYDINVNYDWKCTWDGASLSYPIQLTTNANWTTINLVTNLMPLTPFDISQTDHREVLAARIVVAANPGPLRQAIIANGVGGFGIPPGPMFVIPQHPSQGCNFTVSPQTVALSYEPGRQKVQLQTGVLCAWTATSPSAWLTIQQPDSGVGPATIEFDASLNTTGAARSGSVVIAGHTVQIAQHALRLQVTPSSAQIPVNMPGANPTSTILIAVAYDETGTPVDNVPIAFSATMTNASAAGHSHVNLLDESALDFQFRDTLCVTGPPASLGTCETLFAAPEASGVYELRAEHAAYSELFSAAPLIVRAPIPLIPLAIGATYEQNATAVSLARHPDGWFGQPAFVDDLRAAANKYFDETGGQKLSFNDASLEWGGVFDIDGDWQPPHSWHRIGCSIDVNSKNSSGQLVDVRILSRIFEQLGFYQLPESGSIHFQRLVCNK